MTTVAIRLSDLEVRVGATDYTFDERASADAFEQCIALEGVEPCLRNNKPAASRPATSTETSESLPEPGSVISPSLGGMP